MKDEENNQTIMVVDDIPDNLIILQEILHRRGYRVRAFRDGALALKGAGQSAPDLILLDIMMPKMDGFEVCRGLKENEMTRDIPVIFISGLDDMESKVRAFSEGGVDYVTKPFQTEEIVSRIRTHLSIRSLQRQLKEHNENLEHLVALRTRELEEANRRILEVDRLKDDFLNMISHEIRTPANGIIGIGTMILEQVGESEDEQMLAALFQQSTDRLSRLIDDATLIMDMDALVGEDSKLNLREIKNSLESLFPDIVIEFVGEDSPEMIVFQADGALLLKAFEIVIALILSFSRASDSIRIEEKIEDRSVLLRVELDHIHLAAEDAKEFFRLESPVRGASNAQRLGLSPVVAQKILTAFGGDLRLEVHTQERGELVITLPGVKKKEET